MTKRLGVREGYRRKTPIWQVDVTPTFSHALTIPTPVHCDGKVIADFFES